MSSQVSKNVNDKDLETGKGQTSPPVEQNVPYTIFTKRQKIGIILAASTASFFSPMSANIYVPALNSVAADLNVSNTMINLTLTTYLIFQGLAPTFIGGFSDSAGRRPAYIICLVIYLGANVGLALSPNFAALLVLRCLQSSGSSGTVALANAVAADVVTSAERGEYIAYTSVSSILAPSLAPVLGGILSQYAGWRWIFWFLVIFAMSFFTPFLLFFPETCRKIVGNGSIPPPTINHSLLTFLQSNKHRKAGDDTYFEERDRLAKDRKISFPNPCSVLSIIFSKTAGLALLGNGILFCAYYAITSSLPSQFKLHYDLNDLQISLIFLPFSVGGILSAFTTGRMIDANFRRHARRLGVAVDKKSQADLADFPIERARMDVAIPMVFVGAAGLLTYAWTISSNVHISVPCICLFVVGYSITASFNCMAILLVDMYPGKPATATAANNLVRCWMGAGAAALVVPLANKIGFGWTGTLAAGIWIAFTPVLVVVAIFGPRWRKETLEKKAKEQEKQKQKETEAEAKVEKDEEVEKGEQISIKSIEAGVEKAK